MCGATEDRLSLHSNPRVTVTHHTTAYTTRKLPPSLRKYNWTVSAILGALKVERCCGTYGSGCLTMRQ